MQDFETRLMGDFQTFHFYFALIHKGITILSSMRLELKSLRASELIIYLMQLVLAFMTVFTLKSVGDKTTLVATKKEGGATCPKP